MSATFNAALAVGGTMTGLPSFISTTLTQLQTHSISAS